MLISALRDESFAYLTTVGRITGEPREIEIWFDAVGDTAYLLSGGRDRSDWVKNLKREPRVRLRIGDREFAGVARVVDPHSREDALARKLLVEKYRSGSRDLASWGRNSLPIAIDLGS